MKIAQLKPVQVTKGALQDINALLKQLVHDPATYRAVTPAQMKKVMNAPNMVVVVARDGAKIVGVGLLALVTKFRGPYAYIEDMMVDEAYRGRGLGKGIAKKLIAIARTKGVKTIELSTRPSRIAANKLYHKLGFERKNTNVYRMKL